MPHDATDAELEAAAKPFTKAFWIHPDDLLFAYSVRANGRDKAIPGYFQGGRSNAAQAHAAMVRVCGQKSPLRVLEFAAGYGRVSRYSADIFAGHQYTASDIHPQACVFLKERLGVDAIVSATQPEELAIPSPFDFIFVLSLFSHLPDHSFGRWLAKLYSLLDRGGRLLFTTHGEFATAKFPKPFENMLDATLGYGYGRNSDQPDLDGSEYGTMVVTMPYVIGAVKRHCPGARIQSFSSGVWFGRQDEWVVLKP